MKKLIAVGVIALALPIISFVGNANYNSPKNTGSTQSMQSVMSDSVHKEATRPICDGTKINRNCVLDGVEYKTYIYHPAIPEKSHTETITTYEEKVVGYCTLCNDGTYSPSCATGRGACSWHGGVAQWNAPKYSKVPVYTTKKVVDTPATEAYYEKVSE